MWLHSWEYTARLPRCTRYHYGWVPYGRANVAPYQHLIQIASCSFNEVSIQLGGVFPRDWRNKSQSHLQVQHTGNINTPAQVWHESQRYDMNFTDADGINIKKKSSIPKAGWIFPGYRPFPVILGGK